MGLVELKQGQSVVATLNYVDKDGNILGPVPTADGPSFSADTPNVLSISQNPDGSITIANVNTTAANVDATLTGAAKGFTDTAVITCDGVGAAQATGVKFSFGTPTP